MPWSLPWSFTQLALAPRLVLVLVLLPEPMSPPGLAMANYFDLKGTIRPAWTATIQENLPPDQHPIELPVLE